MANVTLNVVGTTSGTGIYNPVPSSFSGFGTLTLSVLSAYSGRTYQLFTLPNLTIEWENNTLTAVSGKPKFNFTETVNVGQIPSILGGLAGLGIPNIAFPKYSLGDILFTVVTIGSDKFQITTAG